MKRFALIILSILLCVPAFAKKKHRKQKKKPTSEIESAALRHTACFGRCRDYTIEVNSDGMATYTATQFNIDSGVFTKNIGVAKAMEILNQFITYRVDTCEDHYDSRIPDLPGFTYSIKYTTKTKNISDARYGPAFLGIICRSMDELIGEKADESWHRVTPSKRN